MFSPIVPSAESVLESATSTHASPYRHESTLGVRQTLCYNPPACLRPEESTNYMRPQLQRHIRGACRTSRASGTELPASRRQAGFPWSCPADMKPRSIVLTCIRGFIQLYGVGFHSANRHVRGSSHTYAGPPGGSQDHCASEGRPNSNYYCRSSRRLTVIWASHAWRREWEHAAAFITIPFGPAGRVVDGDPVRLAHRTSAWLLHRNRCRSSLGDRSLGHGGRPDPGIYLKRSGDGAVHSTGASRQLGTLG